ncbi:MAG: hypothetical protein SGPRY_011623, partial [Prymnesium sp.]
PATSGSDVVRIDFTAQDATSSPSFPPRSPRSLVGSFSGGPQGLWRRVQTDSDDAPYFYNEALGVSQWSRPKPPSLPSHSLASLEPGPLLYHAREWETVAKLRPSKPALDLPLPPPKKDPLTAAVPPRVLPFYSKAIRLSVSPRALSPKREARAEEDEVSADTASSEDEPLRLSRSDATDNPPARPSPAKRPSLAGGGVSALGGGEELKEEAEESVSCVQPRSMIPRKLWDRLEELRADEELLHSFRTQLHARTLEFKRARRRGPGFKPFISQNILKVRDSSPEARARELEARRGLRARVGMEVRARHARLLDDREGREGAQSATCMRSANTRFEDARAGLPEASCPAPEWEAAMRRRAAAPPRPRPPSPKTHKARARRLASRLAKELG